MSHLRLALLAVDDLGRDDLGGGGLGSGAHAFGLGDDHLGDGSGGRDDRWFGALDGLQALLALKHTQRPRDRHTSRSLATKLRQAVLLRIAVEFSVFVLS